MCWEKGLTSRHKQSNWKVCGTLRTVIHTCQSVASALAGKKQTDHWFQEKTHKFKVAAIFSSWTTKVKLSPLRLFLAAKGNLDKAHISRVKSKMDKNRRNEISAKAISQKKTHANWYVCKIPEANRLRTHAHCSHLHTPQSGKVFQCLNFKAIPPLYWEVFPDRRKVLSETVK